MSTRRATWSREVVIIPCTHHEQARGYANHAAPVVAGPFPSFDAAWKVLQTLGVRVEDYDIVSADRWL